MRQNLNLLNFIKFPGRKFIYKDLMGLIQSAFDIHRHMHKDYFVSLMPVLVLFLTDHGRPLFGQCPITHSPLQLQPLSITSSSDDRFQEVDGSLLVLWPNSISCNYIQAKCSCNFSWIRDSSAFSPESHLVILSL